MLHQPLQVTTCFQQCLAQGALFGSKELLSLSFAARLSLIRCYKTYCGGLFWSFVAYFIICPPLEKGCPDGWQAPQKRYTMGRSTTVQTRDRTTPCWASTSQKRSGSLSRAVDPWLGWDMGSCATYMGYVLDMFNFRSMDWLGKGRSIDVNR